LIEASLSVALVSVAGQAGHEAQHVARVGKAGWKDWNVVRYASEGDFVLVPTMPATFAASMRPSRCMPVLSS
jgi:predicted nuclease of predicted toxin-antitoxin system